MLDFASNFVRQVRALQADFEFLTSVLHNFLAQLKSFEDVANDNLTISVAKVGYGSNQDSIAVFRSLQQTEQKNFNLLLILDLAQPFELVLRLLNLLELCLNDAKVPPR